MKRYLIVGINRYDSNNYPTTEGAANSAVSWQYLLEKKEFSGKILLNEFATSDAILTELKNLLKNLNEDDFAAFIYIGHGGQWPDKVSTEDDEKDELLYPYKFSIKDNEIRTILDANGKNIPILIILDCCRNGVDETLKLFDENKNEVVISAAQANTDMELGEIDHYRQTVFSYYAQTVLEENFDIDYEGFINKINAKIEQSQYQQRPKLITSNYQFLKTKIFSPAPPEKIVISNKMIEDLKKNKNVGLGQIYHEVEDLKKNDVMFFNKILNKMKTMILTKN